MSTLEKLAVVAWQARADWPEDGPLHEQTQNARDCLMSEVRAVVEALKRPSDQFAADFDQDMWCEAIDAILEGR